MSNQWLRLWHDMPTDPKWRTIARVSGQPIALVQAIYLHLLVDASRNVTRGHATVTAEDLASALDVTDEQVIAVLTAMEGRVIDGYAISGWDRRQPKREDAGSPESGAKSAAQRKREQRQRDRDEAEKAGGHDESHGVTQGHAREDKDKEESKEQKHTPLPPSAVADGFAAFWSAYPLKKAKATAEKAWQKLKPSADLQAAILSAIAAHKLSADWQRDAGKYIPHPTTWLNQRRWEDEVTPYEARQHAHGNRPRSAVDEVREAIAAREAAEAVAAAAGQAVVEDDGDLRPALDGEFRRVG